MEKSPGWALEVMWWDDEQICLESHQSDSCQFTHLRTRLCPVLVSLPLTSCLSMLRVVRAGSCVRLDGAMLMGDCLLPYNLYSEKVNKPPDRRGMCNKARWPTLLEINSWLHRTVNKISSSHETVLSIYTAHQYFSFNLTFPGYGSRSDWPCYTWSRQGWSVPSRPDPRSRRRSTTRSSWRERRWRGRRGWGDWSTSDWAGVTPCGDCLTPDSNSPSPGVSLRTSLASPSSSRLPPAKPPCVSSSALNHSTPRQEDCSQDFRNKNIKIELYFQAHLLPLYGRGNFE